MPLRPSAYAARVGEAFGAEIKNVARGDLEDGVKEHESGRQGGIVAAPLAIAAPETGGWRDRESIPAPVAYGLHILDDARDVAEIRVSRDTVRRGAKMGFSRSLITDAADSTRVIAVTRWDGVTLGDAPPSFRPVEVPPQMPNTRDLPPLPVVFGAQCTADGWGLPELRPA